MSSWFECKVRYEKIDQVSGKQKTVTEPYLIDAVSFTDAESRINKEMEPYISGEFNVTNIKRANFSELIPNDNGDRWFKCKVTYLTIDEEKGVEKRTNTYMLVQSNNVKEAYENVEASFLGMVTDYEIPMVQESPLLDVFPYYTSKEDEEEAEKALNVVYEDTDNAEEEDIIETEEENNEGEDTTEEDADDVDNSKSESEDDENNKDDLNN